MEFEEIVKERAMKTRTAYEGSYTMQVAKKIRKCTLKEQQFHTATNFVRQV